MNPGRITASAIATVLLAGALAQPAAAHSSPGDPSTLPKRIVFPIVGPVRFMDDFGAAREQGGHEGIDVLAKRWAPVVATESGRIRIWNGSARAGCMLYLYVHLNNDLTKKDDNEGGCVRGVSITPPPFPRTRVRAGSMPG